MSRLIFWDGRTDISFEIYMLIGFSVVKAWCYWMLLILWSWSAEEKESELQQKVAEVEATMAGLRAKEVDWQRRKSEAEEQRGERWEAEVVWGCSGTFLFI